jgi:23S rRNA pseudouridine955/2504/2580 synthase
VKDKQISRFCVSSDEAGMRLLAFLKEKCPNPPSIKALKRAIEAKGCTLNGKVERFSTAILSSGDIVSFDSGTLSTCSSKDSWKCDVLYEDKWLLICNKPAGMISDNKYFNRFFPSYQGKLELVHRLDKETSGAIILAKTSEIKDQMMDLFAQRMVEKFYLAIVDKCMEQKSGVIDNYLKKKVSYQGQTIWRSAKGNEKGLHAVTQWKCIQLGKQCSLLLCQLLTGRTHQLRVHFSEMHHPILGDFQYANNFNCSFKPQRQLLHSYRLNFVHPVLHKQIIVKAPIPEDFQKAKKTLFPLQKKEMS